MTTFYVSFGIGTLLNGYYAEFNALSEDIVAAYMRKHYKGLWSDVYEVQPPWGRPLQTHPKELCYEKAEHV